MCSNLTHGHGNLTSGLLLLLCRAPDVRDNNAGDAAAGRPARVPQRRAGPGGVPAAPAPPTAAADRDNGRCCGARHISALLLPGLSSQEMPPKILKKFVVGCNFFSFFYYFAEFILRPRFIFLFFFFLISLPIKSAIRQVMV